MQMPHKSAGICGNGDRLCAMDQVHSPLAAILSRRHLPLIMRPSFSFSLCLACKCNFARTRTGSSFVESPAATRQGNVSFSVRLKLDARLAHWNGSTLTFSAILRRTKRRNMRMASTSDTSTLFQPHFYYYVTELPPKTAPINIETPSLSTKTTLWRLSRLKGINVHRYLNSPSHIQS